MKSCIERIRPGDIIVWKSLPESRTEYRYLIMSDVDFMGYDYRFSVTVRTWSKARGAYGPPRPDAVFLTGSIHAVERKRRES